MKKMMVSMMDMTSEMPVYGIYGECISKKGDPNIMEKSQESLEHRFGNCEHMMDEIDNLESAY